MIVYQSCCFVAVATLKTSFIINADPNIPKVTFSVFYLFSLFMVNKAF